MAEENKLKMNLQYFATQDFPEANLTTQETLGNYEEKSIDYTYRFADDLNGFLDALGVTRPFPVQEGFKITLYGKPEVELASGEVAEGDIIPLSKVTPTPAGEIESKLNKYRKAVSAEAIQRYGMDRAVDITDEALVKEIQKEIRDDLFTAIQSGGAQDNLSLQNGLQGALASAWGALQTIFDDDTIRVIAFVHPMDVAQALADKEITLETQFGLNYYTTATGTTVFTSSQVERGEIYATVPENLQVAYVPSNSAVGNAFGLVSDSTGFIGMKHFIHNESATQQTLIMSGILLFPERLDGVIRVGVSEQAVDEPEAPGV